MELGESPRSCDRAEPEASSCPLVYDENFLRVMLTLRRCFMYGSNTLQQSARLSPVSARRWGSTAWRESVLCPQGPRPPHRRGRLTEPPRHRLSLLHPTTPYAHKCWCLFAFDVGVCALPRMRKLF